MRIDKMIIALLSLWLGMAGAIQLNGQQTKQNFLSKLQAEKVAFYTQKMDMTPSEAQKFWPIYNQYSKKKDLLDTEKTKLTRFYMSNAATMTDNDVEVTINKYVKITKDLTDLFEEYNKQFLEVLPPHKVMKLYLAEVQFRAVLLRRIRESGLKPAELGE